MIEKKNYAELKSAVSFVATASDAKAGAPFDCVRVEQFENGGIAFIATDRYRLHWAGVGITERELLESTPIESALVDAKELMRAFKIAKADFYIWELDTREETYALTVGNSTFAGRLIFANFPNWRPLVPALEPMGSVSPAISFNPALLGTTLGAIAKNYKDESATKLVFGANDFKPVRLTRFSESAGALVMPVRGEK